MRGAYITADLVGPGTGGGLVTHHELLALGSVAGEVVVLSGKELSPALFRQPDSVFLGDYFALNRLTSRYLDVHLEVAHFYSGTFSQTVHWLKSRGTKVTYTVPAHDRRTTVEEFGRLGMEYPWHHIKDDDLWAIFSRGYREADVVIAPSRASAGFLVAEGCREVRVVPHGCELPEKVAPLPQQFSIGYLGQIGPDKGLVYALRAWARLNYQGSPFLIAGPNTDGLGYFIRQHAPQGWFKILGFVPSSSDLYNACSVYIQPSVCESFGIEVLEAMAHGRVAIASAGAGASELITDGVDGFVVPIRDVDALAERIDWCCRNQDKLGAMGQRARERAGGYTWERIRGRYQELWQTQTR